MIGCIILTCGMITCVIGCHPKIFILLRPQVPIGEWMRTYNLVGYYDIQFKNIGIILPKFWRGNWKIKIRRRNNNWWGTPTWCDGMKDEIITMRGSREEICIYKPEFRTEENCIGHCYEYMCQYYPHELKHRYFTTETWRNIKALRKAKKNRTEVKE